mgnify:CR=1 FL=1
MANERECIYMMTHTECPEAIWLCNKEGTCYTSTFWHQQRKEICRVEGCEADVPNWIESLILKGWKKFDMPSVEITQEGETLVSIKGDDVQKKMWVG